MMSLQGLWDRFYVRIRMIDEIIERLEQLPYEEWLIEIQHYIERDIDLAYRILRHIAINHEESSWRFNAIQLLLDSNLLREGDSSTILDREEEKEIIGLLHKPTDSF